MPGNEQREPIYQAVGERLHALRKQKGYSRQKVAVLLRAKGQPCTEETVLRWENGTRRIQLHTLEAYAKVFSTMVETVKIEELIR